MSTALTLINRLRSKAREEQVSAFIANDNLHIALLSELNQAIRIVLEERTWNFQKRSDGQLILRLSTVETVPAATAISTASDVALTIVDTNPSQDDLSGDFVTSLIFRNVPLYANTAFDLSVCRAGGTGVVGVLPPMPYNTLVSNGWMLFCYQYALPDTVRVVTEIWHQEQSLEIFQEDEHDFRLLIPRPHEQYGGQPRLAFIGGTLTRTKLFPQSTTTLANAIRIWPVPGTRELLHYTYIYRQADLVNATDAISGVPLAVEDLIVQLAYARQLQSLQADLQRGTEMEVRVMSEINLKHRNSRFDPVRHRTLRSLDELGRRPSELMRSHDTVPGFP